jgi:hydroxymethylglutaryl-CoA lyase
MSVDRIEIVEVGARDGLQNESALLATIDKIELIDRLAATGLSRVEVASFVHPRLVPQMADAEAVVAGLAPSDVVSRIGLVLNERGLERALATSVDEINFVIGASEGFNQANQNASVETTMAAIEAMLAVARAAGRRTTVTISVAFGCPYDGEVDVSGVAALASRSASAGAGEIALGDTIGVAVPSDIVRRVNAVRRVAGNAGLRCHFHDTRNTGVANVVAAVETGVRVIDASVGGTGGCPYAPNATGNVATEDVVYTLHRMGYSTGVDLDRLIETGHWLGERLGKRLPSALGRAGPWPVAAEG